MSANLWCMLDELSSPHVSPLTRTLIVRLPASTSSAVTMQGPKTFAVPILRLRRAHPHRQLASLGIAGREVVPDRVAEDVAIRLLARDVPAPTPDYGGELQLVVQLLCVRRVRDGLPRPDHGVRHPPVECGNLVPLVRYRPPQPAEGVLEVPLKGEEVPYRARPQGREQPGVLYQGLRTDRGTGLDKGDHVAVETGIQDGVALENPYPGPLPGIVGNQPHAPPLIGAAALLMLAAGSQRLRSWGSSRSDTG